MTVEASATGYFAVMFFISLSILVGVIVLQIFLSKQESRWPGLVLPIISFCVSLLAALGIVFFSAYTSTETSTINGEVIQQTVTQIGDIYSAIASAIFTFLFFNIPTILLMAIYMGYRSKRKKQKALEKMSVQDLE